MQAKKDPVRLCPRGYHPEQERQQNMIGRRLSEARRQRGLTLQELSGLLQQAGISISRASIGKWETGETLPNAYQLLAVAHLLGIEDRLSYFSSAWAPQLNAEGLRKVAEYRDDLIASGKYRPTPPAEIRYVEMPVSCLRVSAGTGAFLDSGSFETVSFPEDQVPAGVAYGVRVSGDSMEPVYHDGQIVWVRPCSSLTPGQVGVFLYDGEGYLKRYREQIPTGADAAEFTDSTGVCHPQPVLESFNPRYAPRPVHPSAGFRILGQVL